MIDKSKVQAAISEMIANKDWKEVLFNAPGSANLRIALAFYASKNLPTMDVKEKDEYREFREMLEAQLNAEELKYLTESFARMGVESARTHYQELFSKKTPEEQAEGEKAYERLMGKDKGEGGTSGLEGAGGEGGESSSNDSDTVREQEGSPEDGEGGEGEGGEGGISRQDGDDGEDGKAGSEGEEQ